jgi:glycosyltransferase involved in cell wall biosynthesis
VVVVKVSICIPAFENPNCFDRLIRSISQQSFKDYEIVVTDNSKSDELKMIVDRFPLLDIRYKRNKNNIGMTRNINESIKESTGKYVKLMFSDDWFSEQYSLQSFVTMLDNNPSADFAFSGSSNISSNESNLHIMTDEIANALKKNPKLLFLGNHIGAPSATIYRRNNLFFDSKLSWLVDLDFYIRLLLKNNKFIFTKDPLVSIGIHDNQVTNKCIRDKELNVFEYQYIFKKFALVEHPASCNYLQMILANYQLNWSELKRLELSFIFKLKTKYMIVRNLVVSQLKGLYRFLIKGKRD